MIVFHFKSTNPFLHGLMLIFLKFLLNLLLLSMVFNQLVLLLLLLSLLFLCMINLMRILVDRFLRGICLLGEKVKFSVLVRKNEIVMRLDFIIFIKILLCKLIELVLINHLLWRKLILLVLFRIRFITVFHLLSILNILLSRLLGISLLIFLLCKGKLR